MIDDLLPVNRALICLRTLYLVQIAVTTSRYLAARLELR